MISINFGNKSSVKREKGKSLVELPSNFTVIDIETTGYDSRYDSIIEIGAIKVRNNKIVDTFESLVKPTDYYISEFITELTGISSEMVDTAKPLKDVLPFYAEFIKDDILLGHNVHFDVNFLYDVMLEEMNYKFSNDLVDLLRLSRKIYPEFKNHKLVTVANNLGIDTSSNHRSLKDCEITYESYLKLKDYIKSENINIDELFSRKYYSRNKLDLNLVESNNSDFNEDHMLFNMNCTFTGKLERMERKEAAQLVVDLGGKCLNNITKKTNFLILGNFDYNATVKDGKSSKLKKAEDLILKGQDLQILSENVFYDLVLDN